MYHKGAIEGYPLQTYASALMFSPTGSLIRQLFQHEEPKALTIRPILSEEWSACLQTLESHSNVIVSVAFSHNSTRLASASWDNTVKIWDASSGACLQTLEGHSSFVSSVVFSHDSTWLASASGDGTVKIWDTSGACLQTLQGHCGQVSLVAFSHDSTWLASASGDDTVKIWDASSGACLQTLNVGKTLDSLSFDPTGSYLYSEIRTIDIQTLKISIRTDTAELALSLYADISFSSDGIWIQHAGNNILWVPSEYRSSKWSASGTVIGVGTGSGRVWFCSIDV